MIDYQSRATCSYFHKTGTLKLMMGRLHYAFWVLSLNNIKLLHNVEFCSKGVLEFKVHCFLKASQEILVWTCVQKSQLSNVRSVIWCKVFVVFNVFNVFSLINLKWFCVLFQVLIRRCPELVIR